MKLLIWIHVISAIVGIGPTFLFGVFFQKNQSVSQLKHSINLTNKALLFNKIGGPVALISGIILFWVGNYGTWLQLWVLGAIVIFFAIMVLSIPIGKKAAELEKWVNSADNAAAEQLPAEQEKMVGQIHSIINVIHVFSILLFTLMIVKPIFFNWD